MNDQPEIGIVFTPLDVCKRLIVERGLLMRWVNGESVFDPTAGEGNFLEAFIDLAISRNIKITERMLSRLYGNEIQSEFREVFFKKIQDKFDIVFPRQNFLCKDIILEKVDIVADILIGNPPWANFSDLPDRYKTSLKSVFIEYGLANNPRDLLLGASRVDIAALVTSKTIKENLKKDGEAYYFLPLSIFLNGDAHKSFRSYLVKDTNFSITEIMDHKEADIFSGLVSTRYGLVSFKRDKKQEFPIIYRIAKNGLVINAKARPIYLKDDPLTISENNHEVLSNNEFRIVVEYNQKPRQGINTGGRNDLFIFDSYEDLSPTLVHLSNKKRSAILPKEYVYPLVSRNILLGHDTQAGKWALIPHSKTTGKALSQSEIDSSPELSKYLQENRESLMSRKGVLMQVLIKKGVWWGLLGVGPYSFAPYKIVWQAYGDTKFNVKLLKGFWQANQSMQAFIPIWDYKQGEALLSEFKHPFVEEFLLSHRMEGTCNWAQPGRISKLIDMRTQQEAIF
jgi:hypothetical protein